MTPGTVSARRLAAVHGNGLPHLWRRWHLWACTLTDTTLAPTAAEAWPLLTGKPARPPRARRRCALRVTYVGGVWGCDCDIGGGVVVRTLGSDPCAAIRSCMAIQRAEPR